ncbi:MAG: DNA primase DnaG [Nanoarchaeota archaeon]
MAKISPVSIKYMIHANFIAEGALEKPDIIGAIFGQTEGLLGSDLEMRELQKEGKIGRIEVELERSDKKTTGKIMIPTALDQSETTLIAAAVETIERIGPCDSQIEVTKIEDVRGSKREYIIDRAKKLMQGLQEGTNSREITTQIKESTKMAELREYGEGKLPCGDLSDPEVIVVEGRADVLNLLKNGVKNVIGMNGTKLPEEIKGLSNEKDIILFIDGDRGGKLIAQNVIDNAKVKYICVAPEGKEVEELTGKEILMNLRKRVTPEEFFSREKRNGSFSGFSRGNNQREERREYRPPQKKEILSEENLELLKKLSEENQGSKQAILLDENFKEIKRISLKTLTLFINKNRIEPAIIIIDGAATTPIIRAAEDARVKVIVANNFSTADTNIQLFSL